MDTGKGHFQGTQHKIKMRVILQQHRAITTAVAATSLAEGLVPQQGELAVTSAFPGSIELVGLVKVAAL
jgi:hypothetical protein